AHRGVVVDGFPQHRRGHAGDHAIADGDDRRRARLAVDGRVVAEIFALANVAQDHLAPGADNDDARQAAKYEIDVLALGLIIDDPFAAADAPPQAARV